MENEQRDLDAELRDFLRSVEVYIPPDLHERIQEALASVPPYPEVTVRVSHSGAADADT